MAERLLADRLAEKTKGSPRVPKFLQILGLAFALILTSCATGGAPPEGESQDDAEIAAIMAQVSPHRRSVPGADRERLFTAAEGWLERGFGKLEHNEPARGQLEAPMGLFDLEDRPLPVARKISIEIGPHPFDKDSIQLEILALAMEPAFDAAALETTEGLEPVGWRLVGQDPEFEQWVGDRILERYRLIEQGLDPDRIADAREG